MDGNISLILRAGDDFLDPETGLPIDPPPLPDPTTGIILKSRRPVASCRRSSSRPSCRPRPGATANHHPAKGRHRTQRDGRDGPDRSRARRASDRDKDEEPDPQMAEQIRVLIVDDIPETRDHLSKLLGFEGDIDVVGAAASGIEALKLAMSVNRTSS